MHRFSFLLFAPLILISACTNPKKGVDASSGSSFYVKSVKAEKAMVNIQPKAYWQVPESATFSFQACLTARASHKDLYNQEFAVQVPGEKGEIPVKTNYNACFTWDETIPYNHFAGQSGWVVLERDIVGRGVYVGRQKIQLAVNPWAAESHPRDGGCGAVINMADGELTCKPTLIYPAKEAMHALSGELQGSSRILVRDVKIDSVPEDEGDNWVALLVEVDMKPRIQSTNANGQTVYEDLQDGDFDVMMQIMSANVGPGMDRKVLLLGGETHSTGKLIDGHLKAEFRVRQEQLANQGNLELVMQIRPRALHAYRTLKPFNGMFRLGPGTVVKNHSGIIANSCLSDDGSCDYTKLVSEAQNYQDLVKSGYVHGDERYIFSTLKLRFTSVLPGETATQRTVIYTAQTCITDNQTGRPLARTPLVIHNVKKKLEDGDTDMEPDEVHQSTDENGCLSWNGYNFHKYYHPEHFYPHEVIIEKGQKTRTLADGTQETGPTFNRHMKFYINPWDDKFTFGWDSREFTNDFFEEVNSRPKVRSRFFLSDYNYRTVRFLYNIDRFMELEVHKWVLMNFSPKVLRYSGIVNARKMVEPLRDGIYLMKVGIEKSYLDARDTSGILIRNNPQYQAEMVQIGQHKPRAKEYITTNMALVRVVDGVIVYPIELTMRDLRLMRVRSNMMIELETVDERLIEAFHVFKKYAIKDQDLAEKLEDFKKRLKEGETLDDVRKELQEQQGDKDLQQLEKQRNSVGQSADIAAARKDLEQRVTHIQTMVKEAVARLKARLDNGGNLGASLTSDGKSTGQTYQLQPGTSIDDNFEMRPDLLNELKTVLGVNDFSNMSLPQKQDIDLNGFVEKGTGLEPRTFVGPVIFLNNAYSDSLRATDNLDEANCVNPATGKDALAASMEELDLYYEGHKDLMKSEASLFGNRQNNAYQYNKYYNSLNHLCYKSVDDLMDWEKGIDAEQNDVLTAASLKYNFAFNFGLDAVSLTNETIMKVNPDCKGHAEECLIPAQDHVLKAEDLDGLINNHLDDSVRVANSDLIDALVKRYRGQQYRVEKNHWAPGEYPDLFYKKSLDSRVGLCNLLANKIARDLRGNGLSSVGEPVIVQQIMERCSQEGGLIHDIKLRVDQTGKYTFKGGLNLNFNVGEGFSVGTSSGWSGSFDLTDILGLMGKTAATVLKPVNFKYGTGIGESEGTSVSESTYLVSQIAGFDVELTGYERCAAIRLSDMSVKRLAVTWGDSGFTRAIGLGTANFQDERVINTFKHGLFVCEGTTREHNAPVVVPEAYFYFTQHFTEGDMLDQADLYNHPWLLSLRGMRDFSMFVQKIRAQEIVDLPEFLYHLSGTREPRMKAWALDHMREAFQTVMPTFPGYYTVLDDGESRISSFMLEQVDHRLTKVDLDPLHEVSHKVLMKENAEQVQKPEASSN